MEDWKLERSQNLDENERRGASSELDDKMLKSTWNYVQLYRRATGSDEEATTSG